MKRKSDKEPGFFKWIRAARADMDQAVAGMTPEEGAAYSHARAKAAMKSLPHFPPEEAETRLRNILYPGARRRGNRVKPKSSRRHSARH